MGDFKPPGGVVDHGVGHQGLGGDKGGEEVEINGVNAAVDDEIAGHAEEDEDVHTSVEKWRRKDCRWKTAEAGGSKRARSYQEQAAVILRLGAPIDAKRKSAGEADHVEEGNDEECFCPGLVKLNGIEARHGHGGSDAYNWDGDAEGYSKPAGLLMDADVASADEYRLKNIKDEPGGEDEGVEIEDGGTLRRRVDEVFVHCVAEAVDDGRSDEQRHEEIEIIVEGGGRSCGAFGYWAGSGAYWL